MNILICDDSALARNALARSIELLPNQTLLFAKNGREALEILASSSIDVMFLDLTMPDIDGYQVLESMPHEHPTKVVVVSGDVQIEAETRCMNLGAYCFARKPFSASYASEIFTRLGLVFSSNGQRIDTISPHVKFKELTNIALGKGAAIVSDAIGEFIHLPIPTVGNLERNELEMMLGDSLSREDVVAVTQRFVGSGFHGEALVCLHGSGIGRVGEQLGFVTDDNSYNEIVLNVANLFVSSFMRSLCEQMDVDISLRQPVVLDGKNMSSNSTFDDHTFTVEFVYHSDHEFECEVLFMLDAESERMVNQIMESI